MSQCLQSLIMTAVLQGAMAGIMVSPAAPDRAPDPPPRQITAEERALNQLCSQRCNVEKCYLRHDGDCGNYILCEKGARERVYRGRVLPCAFGTYWAGLALQQKMTCDLPQNVVCNIRPCEGMPLGYKYGTEWNCKAYWECGDKGPEPRCCDGDEYNYFDPAVGECVRDVSRQSCLDTCPIKTDACAAPGALTVPFPDGNCLTFWDCEDMRPHPVCCPSGQGYDDRTQQCSPNIPCNAVCPPEYTPDICKQQDNYTLHDGRCGTFMRCNAIQGDERWCCQAGDYYDTNSRACLKKDHTLVYDCVDECPEGYSVECHLTPVPGQPAMYTILANERQYQMSCAPGTAFREDMCTCGTRLQDATDNSCNMELDIVSDFPSWIRSGSQRFTSINEYGTPKPGTILNNKNAIRFDGSLFYRMSFFQQSMPALYIHLVYLPGRTADGNKQALVSNCQSLEGGTPSVELALQNGQITLALVASSSQNPNAGNIPVTVSVPYAPNDWNQVTAIYDGQWVSIYNDGPRRGLDAKPMTGEIKVAAEGLDVGGCTGRTFMYKGDLAKTQISKCIRSLWKQKFNDATADLTVQ